MKLPVPMFALFITLVLGVQNQEKEPLPQGIVAKGTNISITENEYYSYIARTFIKNEEGKSALGQFIAEVAIKHAVETRGIKINPQAVENRLKMLDDQCRQSSKGELGLDEHIKENDINREDFLEAIRLSVAHELMAKKDFGVADDVEIPSAKLNIWLKQESSKLKVEYNDLEKGVAVRIDGENISLADFGIKLSILLSKKTSSDVLDELVGLALITRKAEELGITINDKDIEAEIRDRGALLNTKEGFKSISYKEFIKATLGQDLNEYKKSPKFLGETLLKKICSLVQHDAYLIDFYTTNKAYFNNRYGRAPRISTIFLKAVMFKNVLTKQSSLQRKFEDAEKELIAIKDRLTKGEATFENMARIYSEHPSKDNGGDLGFIPPVTPGWEDISKAALLARIGMVLGPLQTSDGYHLIRVTDKRDNPPYEKIRNRVIIDARQNFYNQLVTDADVQKRF